MPSVNITEEEFNAVAGAAYDALMKNDTKQAQVLDKLGRKINAALSNNYIRSPFAKTSKPLTWKDVPSIIEPHRKDNQNDV